MEQKPQGNFSVRVLGVLYAVRISPRSVTK